MAEKVEIVIKIPKYYLAHPQDYICLAECVRRGVPLPKGHERLIEPNKLLQAMKNRDADNGGEPLNAVDRGYHLAVEHLQIEIDHALTIIEAESEG